MTTTTLREIAALTSVSLSAPLVILAVAVIWKWRPAALAAWREPEYRTSTQWFVLGVSLAFAASALDNLYWAFAWGSHYLEHPSHEHLFASGVWGNIIFRQAAGIAAAFCHLRAAEMADTTGTKFVNRLLAAAYLLGFLLGVYLFASKVAG
tara:strand:+ start:313 stop:765 length:453 start_codon:yes stop_codon:yes gene_type:complete